MATLVRIGGKVAVWASLPCVLEGQPQGEDVQELWSFGMVVMGLYTAVVILVTGVLMAWCYKGAGGQEAEEYRPWEWDHEPAGIWDMNAGHWEPLEQEDHQSVSAQEEEEEEEESEDDRPPPVPPAFGAMRNQQRRLIYRPGQGARRRAYFVNPAVAQRRRREQEEAAAVAAARRSSRQETPRRTTAASSSSTLHGSESEVSGSFDDNGAFRIRKRNKMQEKEEVAEEIPEDPVETTEAMTTEAAENQASSSLAGTASGAGLTDEIGGAQRDGQRGDVESRGEELRQVFVTPSGVVYHTRRECGKLKSARKVTAYSACPNCSRCPLGGRNVSVDRQIYHLAGMQCVYASQFQPYRPCAECGGR